MRLVCLTSSILLLAAMPLAVAQQPSAPAQNGDAPESASPGSTSPGSTLRTQQPAPPKPYKTVAVTLPAQPEDRSFEAFRKRLGEIARTKDRPALARLVVRQGFFWENEEAKGADPSASGFDILAGAIGLDNSDGSGWATLVMLAEEPTAGPIPDQQSILCAPAAPNFNDEEFQNLMKSTGTDAGEWGFPSSPGIEVRAAAQDNAQIVEKLGMHLVRVLPDNSPAAAVNGSNSDWLRVVTPTGKLGYVSSNNLNALASDQICYSKDATGWHIVGLVSGGGGE
ncbi:MAG TPA: SH3 domain-containing protein [Xanthobacteraceae bacterium]|jgi:hypothetical protein|nr:SH3 domain-containing protein [Xanthobacteraceae bacterium]